MKQPIYRPPYDSPLEDAFAYHAEKYLSEVIRFQPQFEVKTICGRFIVDFVVESPSGHLIGFECDGKEFHNESRDEWRDAMILGCSSLDSIYRLRGSDLTHHMNDVLFILSLCEPAIFSERGRINLQALATREAQQVRVEPAKALISLSYLDEDSQRLSNIFIERRHKIIPHGCRQFWQRAFAFAQEHGGGPLDEVIAAYRKPQQSND